MPLNLTDLRPDEGARTKKKRVGRGTGSGHGKTSGRGTKGQKSRSGPGVRVGFEGGQLPIQKRLPYKRGFTNIYKTRWEIVNLEQLAELEIAGPVTPGALYERRLIRGLEFPVKILGDGDLAGAIEVQAHAFSVSARERIEAAGGSVTELERTDRWIEARPRSRRLPLNRELKQARFGKVGGPQRRDEVNGG
ncbi:MAG: large subunit ribosomal protein [Thermomicrobiales bacterium]|nr:large subunit ribosomal protein [Thermomicrobiales bacterium]